ncbi:DUF5686 family protein [Persicobacter psychrovividus]|uniref:Membrane protein n=1 Tax=Persicobacter psychrovividus TaxID=387638 RepID=A0ABM7VKR9_9BACT|nr:membrane protein [Persicobacter psychrovividus]
MPKLLLVLFAILFSSAVCAQNFTLKGRVSELGTEESIPFANVYLKSNPMVGAETGPQGDFKMLIPAENLPDSLIVKFIGYRSQSIAISADMVEDFLKVHLEFERQELTEVVFKAKENPAFEIIRECIRRSEGQVQRFQEGWHGTRKNESLLYMKDLGDRELYKRMGKEAEKIISEYYDIPEDVRSGNLPIPIFAAEGTTLRQGRGGGQVLEENISNTRKGMGFDAQSIFGAVLGDQRYRIDNLFQNNVIVLDKAIASPLSNFWRANYNMWLMDSTEVIGADVTYKILFEPKIRSGIFFEGYLWINKADYALLRVEMKLPNTSGINFLEGFFYTQSFYKNQLGYYQSSQVNYQQRISGIPGVPKIMMNFSVNDLEAAQGYVEVESFRTDIPAESTIGAMDTMFNVTVTDFSQHIKAISAMENRSSIGLVSKVVNAMTSGFFDGDRYDVGNYLGFLLYNNVEGLRLGLGARSTFGTKHWYFRGYGGYGLKDHHFKSLLSTKYIFSREDYHVLGIQYINDLMPLSMSQFGADPYELNLRFTQWGNLAIRNPFYIEKVDIDYSLRFNRDWIFTANGRMYHLEQANQEAISEIERIGKIKTFEGNVGLRWSFEDKTVANKNFRLIRNGAQRFPVLELKYAYGVADYQSETLPYHRLIFNLRNNNSPLLLFGETSYNITVGKVFNPLPYPLLNVHQGNGSLAYLVGTSQMMNSFEFVSDQFVTANVKHYFNGTIMGRIPGLRWLNKVTKARILIEGDFAWGGLSDENKLLNENYLVKAARNAEEAQASFATFEPGTPYVSFGYGLENIFRLFFIQYWHRFTYLNQPYPVSRGSFKVGFAVKF